MEHMFWNGWEAPVRTLILGVLSYGLLILCLRWSGKRTLSKMNAFDLIVTVSLGSVLASILLTKSVALTRGVLALAVLIGLQFLVTWTSVRFGWVRRLVTGEPQLLLADGVFLEEALRATRVTEDEVRAAVRSSGIGDLRAVKAVVLETDGSFSVVPTSSDAEEMSSLSDVRGRPSDRP